MEYETKIKGKFDYKPQKKFYYCTPNDEVSYLQQEGVYTLKCIEWKSGDILVDYKQSNMAYLTNRRIISKVDNRLIQIKL